MSWGAGSGQGEVIPGGPSGTAVADPRAKEEAGG